MEYNLSFEVPNLHNLSFVALDVELATEKLRLRRKLSSVAVLSHMIMSVLTEWRTLIVVDEAHRGIPDDGVWIKNIEPPCGRQSGLIRSQP